MQIIIEKLNEVLAHIKTNDLSRYMNISDVCDYTTLSKSTIRRNVKNKKLKASNVTGKLIFKVKDVEQWLDNNQER